MENRKSSIDYAAIAKELRNWPNPSPSMTPMDYQIAWTILVLARAIEEFDKRDL